MSPLSFCCTVSVILQLGLLHRYRGTLETNCLAVPSGVAKRGRMGPTVLDGNQEGDGKNRSDKGASRNSRLMGRQNCSPPPALSTHASPLAVWYHISPEDATYVQHTTAFSTYLDRRSVMWSQQFNAFAIMVKPMNVKEFDNFFRWSLDHLPILVQIPPKTVNSVFPSKMLNFAISSVFHPKRFCWVPNNIWSWISCKLSEKQVLFLFRHTSKVAKAESNGHMTDDVRGPYDVILNTSCFSLSKNIKISEFAIRSRISPGGNKISSIGKRRWKLQSLSYVRTKFCEVWSTNGKK